MRYELNRSVHTVSAYTTDLSEFFEWLESLRENADDISTVTTKDIRQWMVVLQEKGVSARSVRRKLQAIRAMFRWAVKRGFVERDPSRQVPLPKFEKRLPVWVRPEVLDAVIDLDDQETDTPGTSDDEMLHIKLNKLIIQMLYETGIRREELITLKDVDVNTERGDIKVLGKRNKERIIPIGDSLIAAIKEYRALRNATTGESVTFFTRVSGEPLYPAYVYKVVKEALSDAGQPGISPHKLRHSFASAMLNAGAEINSVKELLGHSSLASTQVYTHITVSELKENYQNAHPRATKERRKI